MSADTAVNLVCNSVLAASISVFSIMLYRHGGAVRKWPMVGSLALRVGLASVAAGSLANCLTLSTPPRSEIVLNVGLSILFSWAVLFHHRIIANTNGTATKPSKGRGRRSTRQVTGSA